MKQLRGGGAGATYDQTHGIVPLVRGIRDFHTDHIIYYLGAGPMRDKPLGRWFDALCSNRLVRDTVQRQIGPMRAWYPSWPDTVGLIEGADR